VSPSPQENNILNPDEFLMGDVKVGLVSGLRNKFTNTTNATSYLNRTWCEGMFGEFKNLQHGYDRIYLGKLFATTHFTIIFNMFVMMQLFNQICCRVIDDTLNIFFRIEKNYSFFLIMLIELVGQIILVQFTSVVFKVALGGLSGNHWGICIGFAAISFAVNFLVKFLPDWKSEDEGVEGDSEKKIGDSKMKGIKGDSKIRNANLSAKKSASIKRIGSTGSKTKKELEMNNKIDVQPKQPSIKGNHVKLSPGENQT